MSNSNLNKNLNKDLNKDIEELKTKINSLENLIIEKFDKLEKKFDDLENSKLKHVQESCDRMNTHIDFIHETYSTLQTPLNFVKNKVEYLMGYKSETKSLPTIKDKEQDN
jgi:chromosome segregation ATPase